LLECARAKIRLARSERSTVSIGSVESVAALELVEPAVGSGESLVDGAGASSEAKAYVDAPVAEIELMVHTLSEAKSSRIL
jgi:hypothetical protein